MMKKYVRLNDGRIIDTKNTYEQPLLSGSGVAFCIKKTKECVYESNVYREADNVIDLIKNNDMVVNRRGEFVRVNNGIIDTLSLLGIQELFTWDEKGTYRLVATFSGGKVRLV